MVESFILFLVFCVAIVSLAVTIFNIRNQYTKPYRGDLNSSTAKSYPQARVLYPCGRCSTNMPIGNAKEYAEMFNGTVVPPKRNG